MSVKSLIPLATLNALAKAEVAHDRASESLAVTRGKVVAAYMLAGVKRADALADAGTRSTVNVDSLGVTWSQITRALDVAMVVLAGDDTTAHVLTLNMVAAGTVRGLATFADDGSLIIPRALNWQSIAASCPKRSTKGRKSSETSESSESSESSKTPESSETSGKSQTDPDKLTLSLVNVSAALVDWLKSEDKNVLTNEQVERLGLVRKALNRAAEVHNTHRSALVS